MPRPAYPWEKSPVTHRIGGWAGPSQVSRSEGQNSPFILRGIELRHSSWPYHNTDWAIYVYGNQHSIWDMWRLVIRFLARARNSSLLRNVQTGSGAQPSTYSKGTDDYLPRGKTARGEKMTTYYQVIYYPPLIVGFITLMTAIPPCFYYRPA